MVLTEEQRERIRKNKERALQIQRERREEKEKKERKRKENNDKNKEKERKKQKIIDHPITAVSESTLPPTRTESDDDKFHSGAPLEDFEEGASEWVTKTEAMSMYCLPEGTMAICHYEERENPRNPLFKPMKLYKRSEIRYRSHKRFGGLEGLIKERDKRRQRKLEKDMKEAMDIFK